MKRRQLLQPNTALNPAERALMQALKDHGVRCLEAMAVIGSPEG